MRGFCIGVFVLINLSLFAQEHAVISGTVTSSEGQPLQDVYLYLDNTAYFALTNAEGKFEIQAPAGTYNLMCATLGYEKKALSVNLKAGQKLVYNFKLAMDDKQILEAVEVRGQSVIQEVKESAYNVVTVDTKQLANTSMDLSQAMERSSGMRIRHSGGMGSSTAISLNGFTGQHVRVFMDGVPMSSYGSAFQINNIPAGIADHIEIYKGVVPITLGSDALGGAINIVTKKSQNTYVDASFSAGSFHTYKSNLSFGSTSKSGLTFSVNAFQNYSLNDYKVKSELLDLSTNKYSDDQTYWFRRFHDRYHNESVMAQVGFVKKKWADRLMLGFTVAHEFKDIQSANLMKVVYGGKNTENNTTMTALQYSKNNLLGNKLSVNLSANYGKTHNHNVDTLARTYNWRGEYASKSSPGEYDYSLAKYDNKTGVINTTISYLPAEKHQLVLNNSINTYSRKYENPTANSISSSSLGADSIKQTNFKNVLGLAYTFSYSSRWDMSVFGKSYYITSSGPVDTASTTSHSSYASKTKSTSTAGYGFMTKYRLMPSLLMKLSFEDTRRLPTSTELFGDGNLEVGTTTLNPEHSKNLNYNISYTPYFGADKQHSLYFEVGFIYRDTRDYIRRKINSDGEGTYINLGYVRTIGADMEARYYYKNKFSVGGALTYQGVRDLSKYTETGSLSYYKGDRLPNTPFFFGNMDASYTISDLGGAGNRLTVGYYLNYLLWFYQNYASLGDSDTKNTIPTQLSHDVRITYSVQNGRYNISLEGINLTNALLYDNYSLQKPGRSFTVMLRYFFSKSKK